MSRTCTLDKVREKLRMIDSTLEIVSNEYSGHTTRLKFRCSVCANVWASLQQGSGCPECNGGFYSVKRAERHKTEWLKKPAKLYLVKLYNDNELFYKIGITSRSIKSRFKKSNMPYDVEVIGIVYTDCYNVSYFEKDLIYNGRVNNYSYAPMIKFEGHTECFDERIIGLYRKLERSVL